MIDVQIKTFSNKTFFQKVKINIQKHSIQDVAPGLLNNLKKNILLILMFINLQMEIWESQTVSPFGKIKMGKIFIEGLIV